MYLDLDILGPNFGIGERWLLAGKKSRAMLLVPISQASTTESHYAAGTSENLALIPKVSWEKVKAEV